MELVNILAKDIVMKSKEKGYEDSSLRQNKGPQAASSRGTVNQLGHI